MTFIADAGAVDQNRVVLTNDVKRDFAEKMLHREKEIFDRWRKKERRNQTPPGQRNGGQRRPTARIYPSRCCTCMDTPTVAEHVKH